MNCPEAMPWGSLLRQGGELLERGLLGEDDVYMLLLSSPAWVRGLQRAAAAGDLYRSYLWLADVGYAKETGFRWLKSCLFGLTKNNWMC